MIRQVPTCLKHVLRTKLLSGILLQMDNDSEATVHLKTQIGGNSVTALITLDQLLINGIDPQHYNRVQIIALRHWH
jgi:hypothetical protein